MVKKKTKPSKAPSAKTAPTPDSQPGPGDLEKIVAGGGLGQLFSPGGDCEIDLLKTEASPNGMIIKTKHLRVRGHRMSDTWTVFEEIWYMDK